MSRPHSRPSFSRVPSGKMAVWKPEIWGAATARLAWNSRDAQLVPRPPSPRVKRSRRCVEIESAHERMGSRAKSRGYRGSMSCARGRRRGARRCARSWRQGARWGSARCATRWRRRRRGCAQLGPSIQRGGLSRAVFLRLLLCGPLPQGNPSGRERFFCPIVF